MHGVDCGRSLQSMKRNVDEIRTLHHVATEACCGPTSVCLYTFYVILFELVFTLVVAYRVV